MPSLKLLVGLTLLLSTPASFATTIEVTNTNDNGSGSLRDAIDLAADGDTITFDASLNNATILFQSEIDVNKDITIDGDDRITLDGQNSTRLMAFAFQSQSTVKNITFQNGLSTSGSSNPADDRGGAVKVHSQAQMVFYNVKFLDNEAGGYGGGAVGATGNDTRMRFEDCTFERNHSYTNSENGAGAICLFAGGANAILEVVNSHFEDNEGVNGGALGSSARIYVEGSTFLNNNTLTAPNNNYEAGNSSPRGSGGAIYTDRPSSVEGHHVINSTFIGNAGAGYAGAVSIFSNSDQVNLVKGCHFENNSVTTAVYVPNTPFVPKGHGGALHFGLNGENTNPSEFIVENSTFVNNTSVYEGGALWITRENSTTRVGSAQVLNCTFVGNEATGGTINERRGAAITTYFDTEINNCTFADNTAESNSAAIYVNPGTTANVEVTVQNSIFSNNTSGDNTQTNVTHLGFDNIQFPNNGSTEVTSGILFADPLLSPLDDNGGITKTMALQTGSPAIDAGNGCTTFDQRGAARVGTCDLGAFEFGAPLGFEEIVETQWLHVYPNPNNGTLTIASTVSGEIKVYNLIGGLVFTTEKLDEILQLDLRHLKNGTYLVQLGNSVERFVKE